jgi:hypothetical protein
MDVSAAVAKRRTENRPENRSKQKQQPTAPSKLRRLYTTFYGRVAIGIAASAFIVTTIVLLSGGDDEDPQPKPTPLSLSAPDESPPPKEAKPTEVQIEIRGMPEGAKIYFDGAPVPVNPFRVALKEVIVSLKIEAAGYDDWATSLVPAEDQVVKVEMTKKEAMSMDAENGEEADNGAAVGVVKSEPVPHRPSGGEKSHSETKRSSKTVKQEKDDETGFKTIKKDLKFSNEFD